MVLTSLTFFFSSIRSVFDLLLRFPWLLFRELLLAVVELLLVGISLLLAVEELLLVGISLLLAVVELLLVGISLLLAVL